MSGKLFDPHLDLLERRFQALRDQIEAMPEACRPELEGALQELSQAIAALRADREGRTPAGTGPGQPAHAGGPAVDRPAASPPASHDQLPAASPGSCETILNHLFCAIPDLITIIDRDCNIVMSNWQGFEVPEEMRRGQPKCYRVYHRRDRPCEDCHALTVFATGQPQKIEKTSDLDGRVLELSVFPILDESGQVSMVVEHVRDIQERYLAAEALKESEDRFRTLIEDSPESLFLTDVQGTILAASRVAAERLGKSLAEVTGAISFDLFPPEVAAYRWPFFAQAVATGRPVRLEDARGDRNFEINFNPILDGGGKVSRLSILAIDITDRKNTEQALKDSEATLRTLIEANPESLFLLDPRGMVLAASRVAAQRLGKSLEEIIGTDLHGMLPPEVSKKRFEIMQWVVATGQPARFEDVRGDFYFDSSITPIFDQDKVVQIAVLGVDITARKNAEQAMRESEERFRAIFATAQDSIFIKDRSFRYVQVNPALERLFGRPAAGIIGKTDLSLVGVADTERIRKEDRRVLNGEVVKGIHTVTVQDVPVTFHYIKAPLRDEAGEIVGICGIARDITDLKQMEAALAESEERFRMLFEYAPDAYILADMQGEIIDCNQAAEELAGYGREELIGNNFACLPWLDFRQQVRLADLLTQTARGEVMGPVDFNLTRKDVGEVIAEGMSLPLYIQGQNLVLTIVRDITARKLAEAALRGSEARFRHISSTSSDISYSCTAGPDGNYVIDWLAGAAERITGYSEAEIKAQGCWRFLVIEADLPRFERHITGLIPGSSGNCELRLCHKNGEIVWVASFAKVVQDADQPELILLYGGLVDITAHKQAEEALKVSEERYRMLFEAFPDAISLMDADMNVIMANPCGVQLFRTEGLPAGTSSIEFVAPEDRLRAQGMFMDLLETGETQTLEITMRRQDGSRFPSLASLALVRDAAGRPQGIIGISRDITALKQAEAELRQSEQRFRLMAETIQDVFWIATPDIGKIMYVSPACEQVWGRTGQELYQSPQTFLESIHPEDRDRALTEIVTAREQGSPSDHEYRIIRPDGAVRWIHDRGFPVKDDQGQVIMFTGVATDVTGHKALEGQLLQAQKMEAVGRLAGGVAHDFNNLLMAIMGYGELMRAKVFRDDPLYGHLENILKAGDRAAALTKQLLTFSRQQIIQPQVIDLNRVVLDLEPMLRRLIGEDLHLEVVTDRRPVVVKADPGQMGQIVMNLVVNARDAMPQGGRLTLETAAIDLTEGCYTRFGLTPPGAYVRLEVQDTGVGMDEATQNHVFEPFFTTKEPGKGTGLGLSTVYGIVKQSGGYLDLESSPGAGSTFTIYLPRLEAIVEPPRAKIPLTASFQGEETILLVEDEDMLRGLLAKFLRLYGYTVLEARHGGEALLACERHLEPIHLMVTDVVMPQMSGRELADRLTPLRPEMKVLYMSGYTEDALVQHGVAELSVVFLQKPFRPIELVRRVHAVLHLPETL